MNAKAGASNSFTFTVNAMYLPQRTTDSKGAQLQHREKLPKAQLYANILWRSSATAERELIGSVLIPAETEPESQFTSWRKRILNKTEDKLFTDFSIIYDVCLTHYVT